MRRRSEERGETEEARRAYRAAEEEGGDTLGLEVQRQLGHRGHGLLRIHKQQVRRFLEEDMSGGG